MKSYDLPCCASIKRELQAPCRVRAEILQEGAVLAKAAALGHSWALYFMELPGGKAESRTGHLMPDHVQHYQEMPTRRWISCN